MLGYRLVLFDLEVLDDSEDFSITPFIAPAICLPARSSGSRSSSSGSCDGGFWEVRSRDNALKVAPKHSAEDKGISVVKGVKGGNVRGIRTDCGANAD